MDSAPIPQDFFGGVNGGVNGGATQVNGTFIEMSQDAFNIPQAFVPQHDVLELFPRGGQALDFVLSNDLCQFEIADGLDYVDAAAPPVKPPTMIPRHVDLSTLKERKCDVSLSTETEEMKLAGPTSPPPPVEKVDIEGMRRKPVTCSSHTKLSII